VSSSWNTCTAGGTDASPAWVYPALCKMPCRPSKWIHGYSSRDHWLAHEILTRWHRRAVDYQTSMCSTQAEQRSAGDDLLHKVYFLFEKWIFASEKWRVCEVFKYLACTKSCNELCRGEFEEERNNVWHMVSVWLLIVYTENTALVCYILQKKQSSYRPGVAQSVPGS
jgi:hypothetical protein